MYLFAHPASRLTLEKKNHSDKFVFIDLILSWAKSVSICLFRPLYNNNYFFLILIMLHVFNIIFTIFILILLNFFFFFVCNAVFTVVLMIEDYHTKYIYHV